MLKNEEITHALRIYADLLETQGDNPYRIRAYRRAARTIERLDTEITTLLAQEFDLTTLSGIGKMLDQTIREMIMQGTTDIFLKKVIKLSPTKKISLRSATPFRLFHIVRFLEHLITKLKALPGVKQVVIAGEFRRRQELVNTVEIILEGKDSEVIIKKFLRMVSLIKILQQSSQEVHIITGMGLPLSLKCVSSESFGAGLLFATGSKDHIHALQKQAEKKHLQLTMEGLFQNKILRPSHSEAVIYNQLDLSFVPPEMREMRGEIALAAKKSLPKLIELSDIRGDLHCHTDETDGRETLETMAEAAKARGYEYLAITDHSKHLRITNGLDEKRLLNQIKKIDQLNEKLGKIFILKSIELDILEDGTLDLSPDVLKELNFTVCSIHSKFSLSEEKQTERVLRAMDNPYFNIFGHATGRLIKKRPPYALNMPKIMQAAAERGVVFEVNAQPYRLDLNDSYCQQAKRLGLRFVISSDAHSISNLDYMIYGIWQARRGWLEAQDVLNTLSLQKFLQKIKRF